MAHLEFSYFSSHLLRCEVFKNIEVMTPYTRKVIAEECHNPGIFHLHFACAHASPRASKLATPEPLSSACVLRINAVCKCIAYLPL